MVQLHSTLTGIATGLFLALYGCGSPQPDRHATAIEGLSYTCDTCSIQLGTKAMLGHDSDPIAIVPFSALRGAPAGQFWIAPMGDLSQIGRFDSLGNPLQPLGRSGDGPGEFRLVQDVMIRPDRSVLVLDRRLTLLSPQLTYSRTVSLPNGRRASRGLVLESGTIVLNCYSIPGRPFLLLNPSLDTIKSVGTLVDDDPEKLQFQIAADHKGGFWSVSAAYGIMLEHWSSAGDLLKRIVVQSEWFPKSGSPGGQADPMQVRPAPRISGISIDSSGLIWLVAILADENWKPSTSSRQPHEEGHYILPSPGEWPDLYDTGIAAVSPATGRIVAARRYGGVIGGLTGSDTAWELVEQTSGGLRMRVASLSLIGPTH